MAFEKVSPKHPDKIADCIAGAIVDLAYTKQENPKVAAEVLLGHGCAHIIIESSVNFDTRDIEDIVYRLTGGLHTTLLLVPQDKHLAANQEGAIRCGDNGIFKGVPLTEEEKNLTLLAQAIYQKYPYDGKYISDNGRIVICHSNTQEEDLRQFWETADINPLGYWTGGPDVDSGATNRKLGSDMAQSATGGGLHGKDLSKADVSVNIYAFLKAQKTGQVVELSCAIGDEKVDGKPYSEIVEIARQYIKAVGGFEKFAQWGLVR